MSAFPSLFYTLNPALFQVSLLACIPLSKSRIRRTMSAAADKRSMRLLMVCAVGTLAGILMASADRKASKAANGALTVEDRLKQLDHK
jgi:hypothetical protein